MSQGSSQGLIFNFDWGASDSFAFRIKEILQDYITGDVIEDK
ncbi:hypothetical protein [Desulfitobacterium sp.]|nr:hypothetical protein [Desulfitobacterium sp.]HVJ47989.1 hypothetical protein [Desulfitobacterium sp.]